MKNIVWILVVFATLICTLILQAHNFIYASYYFLALLFVEVFVFFIAFEHKR